MIRVFYIGDLRQGGLIELSGEESHHLVRVRRKSEGESVEVLNGEGVIAQAKINQVNKKTVVLKVYQVKEFEKVRKRITLVQAMPKGKVFERIIQEGTQLGVYEIVPLVTKRTEKSPSENQLNKWVKVAQEACKQSGNPFMPKIADAQGLKEFIKDLKENKDLKLVGSLCEGVKEVRDLVGADTQGVMWFIGPEGDFTDEEYELLEEAGVEGVRLSEYVLRAETAAVYALSVVDNLLRR